MNVSVTGTGAIDGCGEVWMRDSGDDNIWLPLPEPVDVFVRARWTQEQIDGIYTVSRVEANARNGAEVSREMQPGPEANIEGRELRRIYIIESNCVDERLVVFEDGELLRTVDDPDFHAYNWDEM